MQETVPILIHLGGRQYKIKVSAEDEAQVRKMLAEIHQKNLQIKEQFPGRDEQDYLAMTLMDYISSRKVEPKILPDIDQKIKSIFQLINE
ncbi:MAG: cell division protein ZapA [Chitinophagaceae bacterium]|jgi:hypothetical protein|nr:cell division protein ZapA [Chitinophagaceae bacterium]